MNSIGFGYTISLYEPRLLMVGSNLGYEPTNHKCVTRSYFTMSIFRVAVDSGVTS